MALCEGNAVALRNHMSALLSRLTPFLAHPLFIEDMALPVMKALTLCLDTGMRPLGDLIARAIVSVLPYSGKKMSKIPTEAQIILFRCVQDVYTLLQEQLSEHGDVSSASFNLFSRIIFAVLEQPAASAVVLSAQQTALRILRMHSSPQYVSLPRAEMLRILLHVLAHGTSALHRLAPEVLASIAEGMIVLRLNRIVLMV